MAMLRQSTIFCIRLERTPHRVSLRVNGSPHAELPRSRQSCEIRGRPANSEQSLQPLKLLLDARRVVIVGSKQNGVLSS